MIKTYKKHKRSRKRKTNKRIRKMYGGSSHTEKDNKYVSSRGILLSCDIHSPNPISSMMSFHDVDFTKIKDGSTVYITGTAIRTFLTKIESIPNKIILVSGDCDETIPEAVLSNDSFIKFIESDKIIHWFSQNCVGKHPKLSPIPIGLDYHSIKNTSIKYREDLMNKVKSESKSFHERLIQCYSNFHFAMGEDRKYTYDRRDALAKIPPELLYKEPTRVSHEDTFTNQSKYAFVISPHGNGLDCHRTWEALVLGCIPIVKTSPIDSLYDDLPVLILKDWGDLTKELLEKTIHDFKSGSFNLDKLTLKYWMDKINAYKK